MTEDQSADMPTRDEDHLSAKVCSRSCRHPGLFKAAAWAIICVMAQAGSARADNHGFAVVEIAPGVYVHHGVHEQMSRENLGGIANIGFVVGDEAVAVIDSGGSARQGAQLLAAVRNTTDLPIRYVINTHVHPDHVFGNSAFAETGAIFVGHAKLPRALAARGSYYLEANRETLGEALDGTEVITPSLTVAERSELDLGNRVLELVAHPTAHTDNDLTVLDRKTATLWLGDLLFVERIPVVDGSLKGWLAVMADLRRQPAARAVPGHGPVSVAWPDALDDQQRYLEGLLTEIRTKIAAGDTIQQATRSVGQGERGRWLLFDDYNARNVTAGFAELEWE